MNPRDPNVQQLQIVAKALGHLRETLVLVGGCATGVLITDNARPPVRATQDVDLIAEIATKAQYYELAADLRELGFREDTEDVICRWRLVFQRHRRIHCHSIAGFRDDSDYHRAIFYRDETRSVLR